MRMLVSCLSALASFFASWWLFESFGMSQGTSLSVAGAVMALVLFVAGFWIARTQSGNDVANSSRWAIANVGRVTLVIVCAVVSCCTATLTWTLVRDGESESTDSNTSATNVLGELADTVQASLAEARVELERITLRRTKVEFTFTVKNSLPSPLILLAEHPCRLMDNAHRDLWRGTCRVEGGEGSIPAGELRRFISAADVTSVESAAYAYIEVTVRLPTYINKTLLLPEAELRPANGQTPEPSSGSDVIADLADTVQASLAEARVELERITLRRTKVEFTFTVKNSLPSPLILLAEHPCRLMDNAHRDLWRGTCRVEGGEGSIPAGELRRFISAADVTSVESAAYAYIEVTVRLPTYINKTLFLPAELLAAHG